MDPATMTTVVGEFMKQGVIGAVVIVLMVAVGALWKKFTDSQDARLKDAGLFMDRLVTLLEKTMTAQTDTNTVLEIIKDRVSHGRRTE